MKKRYFKPWVQTSLECVACVTGLMIAMLNDAETISSMLMYYAVNGTILIAVVWMLSKWGR